jgi:hypothetical protein
LSIIKNKNLKKGKTMNRCTVAMKHDDGSYSQIYCHNNGNPEFSGPILLQHYAATNQVEALFKFVTLGALLTLHKDALYIPSLVCPIYGPNRGETGLGPCRFNNKLAFDQGKMVEKFNYLFENGIWSVNGSPLVQKISGN